MPAIIHCSYKDSFVSASILSQASELHPSKPCQFIMTSHSKPATPSLGPSSSHSSAVYYRPPPIFRLPVETLSRIFEFGTYRFGDDNVDAMSDLDFNLWNFPMCIAAVCKRFRTIAHSTPSLWTTLQFYFPRPLCYSPKTDAQPDECAHGYARDRVWLTRSRACALDVILCYRDPSWMFTEERHYFRREHMEHILSLLEPHAWRIRRFTLICDTFAPIHASLEFLSRKGGVMRKLSILELYRCNEYVAEYPRFYPLRYAKPIALTLDHALLKRLILAGVHIDWNRHFKSEALRFLDTLDISYHSRDTRPSLEAFTETLRASPDLKTLSVIGSGPLVLRPNTSIAVNESQPEIEVTTLLDRLQCILPPNLPSLSFRQLSVLKLGFYNTNDAILILSLVFNYATSGNHPPLKDLTLKDLSQPSETNVAPGTALLTFLIRLCDRHIPHAAVRKAGDTVSFKESDVLEEETNVPFTATLSHLTLECIKATKEAFTGLLDISPTLETLTLDGVSSCVLSALCPPSPPSTTEHKPTPLSATPCPMLKTLSLRFLDFPTERITSYTALTKYRAAAGIPLDRLVIHHLDVTHGLRETDAKTAKKYVTDDIEISGGEDEILDEYEDDDPFAPGGAFNDPEFDALYSAGN